MSRPSGGRADVKEPFPWRAWMRTGIGGLGWQPAIFWAATMTEFFEAIDGRNEAQGGKKAVTPPTDDEVNALVAKYG